MTTFYRLKENGKILDYTEFELATETTTQMVTRYETKEVVEQEKVYDENGEYVLQDVVKTIEVPYEVEETVTIDHVPAFIRELYIETERKIIKLVDGSFAFEDEVNLAEEEIRRVEKEFNEAVQKKLAEVDQWTASKIVGGFVSNSVRYDSDMDTQTTMQGIALNVNTERFAKDYPHGIPVRGYDEGSTEKTIHYLTAEEVLMFCADLSEHIGRCKLDGWTMQQAVLEATTKEELEAIVLD